MNNKTNISLSCLLFAILMLESASGQKLSTKGQVIGWGIASHGDEWTFQTGLRYIPQINFDLPVREKFSIDGEFSFNSYGSYTNPDSEDNFSGRIKPYRMWIKFSGEQFELRAGLQKINFGSAITLRPLMWFDRMDPTDPLQLTDGVYGLLGRYYFLNNTNIWLWTLYGNKSTKGWEMFESDQKRPEFGGRIQLPLRKGEIALSYHNRVAMVPVELSDETDMDFFNESKYAIDTKLDLGVGIWLEAALTDQNHDLGNRYTAMITTGVDYTFGIGNGLNISAEYFSYQASDKLFNPDSRISMRFGGMSANYPISIVSSIGAIMYYNPATNDLYKFLNLGLNYDQFSYYFIAFWNPQNFELFNFDRKTNLFAGKGLQFLITYNY